MTFVVTENCHECRFTDCVDVCPADCFHADDKMLYIDPETCIDCGACVPECPVEAIYEESQLREQLGQWRQINAERAKALPVITKVENPLPMATARRAQLGF